MADYFVILKRAVDAMPDSGREQRQAIYDKARKALLAQLQNMDPPLAASEISKQRMALEEAVRAVERELDLAQQAKEEEAKPDQTDEDPSRQDARMPVVAKPASDVGDEASRMVVPPSGADDDLDSVMPAPSGKSIGDEDFPPPSEISDPVVIRAGPDVLKHAVRDAKALGAATNAAVKSAQDAADAVGEGQEDQRSDNGARVEPTLGMSAGKSVVKPSISERIEPQLAQKKSEPAPSRFSDVLEEEAESKSRFGFVVGGVLIAGLLGGSGYLLYQNRDALIGDQRGGEEVASTPNPNSDQSSKTTNGSGVSGLETNGLVNDATGIPAKSVRTVDVSPPSKPEDPVAPEQEAGSGQTKSDPSEAEQGVDASAPEIVTVGEDQNATAAEATKEAPSGDDAVAVAQRSILYEEEGPDGQPGSANPGDVLWSLDGAGEDAAIIVSATIPNQSVTYQIKVTKNKDADLPASHLIEISANRPTPDDARAISKIPGLILKPTEQSRGEGLVGAAIKIADDLHWIALTAGEKEERYNLELLTLRSWIDIPIQYNSGVRAILTLEKGKSGERVIEEAIKAWGA